MAQRSPEPSCHLAAAACAALVNFPLWKATIIRQSGFQLRMTSRSALGQFLDAYRPPYRGVLAAFCGMTWARTAIFYGSERGRRLLQSVGVSGSLGSGLPALATAACCQCVNNPLFKAIVRLQDSSCTHRTVRESFVAIYASHGVRGLVHGTSAGVLKTAPKYGAAVVVRDWMEHVLPPVPPGGTREQHVRRSACKGLIAGLGSAVMCNPFDVLRNHMFKHPGVSLVGALRQLIDASGPLFVVRGLRNNVLAVTLPIGLTIFLADFFQRLKDEALDPPGLRMPGAP